MRMADLDTLRRDLASRSRVLIAFSGGADSAFLARVALDVLGPDRVVAVTAVSPSLAEREREHCRSLTTEWGMPWREVHTEEMENAAYLANDLDRCFWCKDALMDALEPLVEDSSTTVLLGVNVDDLGDHRPGQKAAADRGAVFPLVDAGFTKQDVRDASRAMGLSTWDKPAAPCLASRLPYGTSVTLGRLRSVEQAEDALMALGFPEVRVRHHGELARVEVPKDALAALVNRQVEVVEAVRDAGYRWVTVDLDGLRSGNLNPISGG